MILIAFPIIVGGKMKKVGIIVVTYNRIDCLKTNLEKITSQIQRENYEYHYYIIDNASTDSTQEYVTKYALDYDNFHYVRLEENTGGAGGFNAGIKKCVEDNMDYLWGMDDDAYPDEKALTAILNEIHVNHNKCCYYSNNDGDTDFTGNVKEVSHWMFVGFFMPIEVVREIGYPREDFFIYYDDAEYASRILKRGYKILKVKESIISHKASCDDKEERKFLYRTIKVERMPVWKTYYYTRNDFLRHKVTSLEYWKVLLYRTPKRLFKLILFAPEQVKNTLLGSIHGILRISGKRNFK